MTNLSASALAFAVMAMAAPSAARSETIEIYAAGSLSGVVEALKREAGPGTEIKATIGPSGGLRDRIEGGEKPDLFLSADMASPRKLAEMGRAVTPVIAFAQNRMCLISRRSLGVTQKNIVSRMLDKKTRLKTNPPVLDPGGDYAVAIFDRIEASHKGAGTILRAKMERIAEDTKSTPNLPGHSSVGTQFLNNQIDMMIAYCSGAPAQVKEVPDLVSLPFPAALEPQPVDGLVVLSSKPDAMRLALLLLSEKGQAIVKEAGLLPVLSPPR
jgi:molybdate transport system substrate-binding protein